MVPGVMEVEAEAVSQEAEVVTPHVVAAVPALMVTVWEAGVAPGAALKVRLAGETARATAV